MKDTMIGVDLAKRVFQLHGATTTGYVTFRKKLTREQFQRFMAEHPSCVVVFEACGSASYWAREMAKLGHQAKLIAPQYVRPFVKRQKNDAADAEAIVIAARQPEMRFVIPKTEDQQTKAILFRAEKTDRINARTKALKELADETDTARRLQTMPGVGPLTSLAVAAFAPDMAEFRCGRDFAAWLGLVPRQHSSGGKARLGRVSKAGQADIRRLLIIGAMTRIMGRARHNIPAESWIGRMLARKPKMLVVIALANKMARQIWAMLTRNEDYRDPVLVPAV